MPLRSNGQSYATGDPTARPVVKPHRHAVMRAELINVTTATVRALGITSCAATPVLELCRTLVAAGVDPTTPLAIYRGGTLALRVRSVGESAGLIVKTDRSGRPRFRHVSMRWSWSPTRSTRRKKLLAERKSRFPPRSR